MKIARINSYWCLPLSVVALLFGLPARPVPANEKPHNRCHSGDFSAAFELIALSPTLSLASAMPTIEVRTGTQTRNIAREDYQMPIERFDRNYILAGSGATGNLLPVDVRFSQNGARARADWIRARFDGDRRGDEGARPVERSDPAGRLDFVREASGCWQLVSDQRAPSESLFTAGPAPERRLNCRAIPDDCPKEGDEVERLILRSPALAQLRREADLLISERKHEAGVTKLSAKALDADEAMFRQNLKRGLYFADGADSDNRDLLSDALEYRLEFLKSVTLGEGEIEGHWQNASGSIVIASPVGGLYRIFADRVDVEDLGWTCEIEATGALQGETLFADLGRGESLTLRLEGGILRSDHKPPPLSVSPYCGGGGHANGTWFRRTPLAP